MGLSFASVGNFPPYFYLRPCNVLRDSSLAADAPFSKPSPIVLSRARVSSVPFSVVSPLLLRSLSKSASFYGVTGSTFCSTAGRLFVSCPSFLWGFVSLLMIDCTNESKPLFPPFLPILN